MEYFLPAHDLVNFISHFRIFILEMSVGLGLELSTKGKESIGKLSTYFTCLVAVPLGVPQTEHLKLPALLMYVHVGQDHSMSTTLPPSIWPYGREQSSQLIRTITVFRATFQNLIIMSVSSTPQNRANEAPIPPVSERLGKANVNFLVNLESFTKSSIPTP